MMEEQPVADPTVVAAKQAFITQLEELANEQAKTLFFFNTKRSPTRQTKRRAIREYMAALTKAQTKEDVARTLTNFFKDARIQKHASGENALFDPNAPYDKKLSSAPDTVKKFIAFLAGEANAHFRGIFGTNDNVIENMFFPSHSGLSHRTATNKFFVFDRDDTLLDIHEQLIHPKFLLSLMKTIVEAPDMQWALASKGASGNLAEDPVYQRIAEHYPEIATKKPGYPIIVSSNSMLNRVVSVEKLKCHKKGEVWEQVFARKFLQDLFSHDFKTLTANNSEIDFKQTQWVFLIGKTHVRFSVPDEPHLKQLMKGSYKLFSVLEALDMAELTVGVTDELRAFGIIGIQAPEHYEIMEPKDVVFVDDKPENCEPLSSAGFTAIHADTPALREKIVNRGGKYEGTLNTYQAKLEAALKNKPVQAFRMGGPR